MKDYSLPLLFDYYSDYLGEKQREVFDSYYNEDLSLSEVAENFGITRQGVRDSVKRTEQQICELEEKLHLCEKSEKLKAIAASVKSGETGIETLLEYIENF